MIRWLGRVLEFFSIDRFAVDRTFRPIARRSSSIWRPPTHDWGRPDYEFWRRVYWGKAKGLELSGLFVRPLVNKLAAWTLGQPPALRCENLKNQVELEAWWDRWHPVVLTGYRAALRQGDSFLLVNSDLSVTVVRPDAVEPIVDDLDYGKIVGWRVVQTMDHPARAADRLTIVDEYTLEERVRIVYRNSLEVERTRFRNLLPMIPVVHIANQVDDGETFGHPEAEALIELFHQYGATLDAALEGNQLQGRPTPVISFDSKADMDRFWDQFGRTQRTTLPDGTVSQTSALEVDLSQVLTVSAASFEYKSPGSFSSDTVQLLGILFYLFLQHTELPEFVMGNAISSSKASAETQMPVFERFIAVRRREITSWLIQLFEIVLAYLSLLVPGTSLERPVIQWQKLTQDGRLTLDALKWALTEGLIDHRTALSLAPLEVEDLDEVLRLAQDEREQLQRQFAPDVEDEPQFDEALEQEIAAALAAPKSVGEGE